MRRVARTLVYVGIAAAVVGLSLYHARLIADPPYSYTGTFRFGWSLVYMALLALMAYGLGLPDVPRTQRQALLNSIGASFGAAFGMSVVQLFVGDSLLPRFVVFGAAILLVPWYLVCALIANGGATSAAGGRDRVLVVGDSVDPTVLRQEVSDGAEKATTLTSIVPLAAVDGTSAAPRSLIDLAEHDRATVIVLDRDAQASESIVAQAAELHERGIRVRTLSLFYDEWLGMLPLRELERVSLMFDIGEVHRQRYGRIKRLVDVVVGLASCLVLVIAVPFVLLGNLIGNRGPLFYRQDRVGRGGSDFEILKFRSMREAKPGETSDWTAEGDPRITAFGGILRKSHLDELPQAVNILRGDISVVGPRPEQRRYVVELVEKLPFYDLRHLVRPGLTGWAQVKQGYAADERDAMVKLQYEFWYLRHQSLGLDLRIIGRTIRSVLGREGSMSEQLWVSVLVPARNEAGDITRALEAISAQDYPHDRLEVIVVDGGSTDATAEVVTRAFAAADFGRARIVSNPTGTTPSNLNAGLAECTGEFLCRVDARSIVPPDYVRTCVEVLGERPDIRVTGGAQVATARDDSALAVGITRALNNRWGMGLARYRRGAGSGPTETVYLGAFRTEQLRDAGGWDERFTTNQDFELNRRMGADGVVWFDASLAVQYLPRADLAALFQQYRRFGSWKVRYWRDTGDRPQSRQILLLSLPIAAVIGLVVLAASPRWLRRILVLLGIGATTVFELRGPTGPPATPPSHAVGIAASAAVGAGWTLGAWSALLRGRR